MKKIIFIILSLVSFSISAQDDAVRSMINRTEIAISKAQKHIISGEAQARKKDLSMAVRYQALAVDAFKKNDLSMSTCCASISRECCIKVLTEAGISGLNFYLLNDEEKALVAENKCDVKSEALEKTVAVDIIGDPILLDPGKLNSEYKISLNN